MVLNASNFLRTDIVIMGIIVIGVLAYLFDLLMRKMEEKLIFRGRARCEPAQPAAGTLPATTQALGQRSKGVRDHQAHQVMWRQIFPEPERQGSTLQSQLRVCRRCRAGRATGARHAPALQPRAGRHAGHFTQYRGAGL
jgi:hypothetical protein